MPFVLFSLIVAWGVMLLFGGLEMDSAILMLAYAGDRPDILQLARIVTELGGWLALVPLTIAGAILLLARGDTRGAFLLLVLTLSGRFLVDLQKVWTARIRPEEHEHLVAVQSLSFPSAHAANATMVYVSLALLLFPGRGRALALWIAAWLALLIGASRVLLGVHWPSDVIAGWAFGLFWTFLLFALSGRTLDEGTPPALRHSPWQGGQT
ncbi:MAG: phosphatase PAP2 family protein [Allosphingosinicella sp.]|uniref:phosphatase PAP2 family protein n=1 Tax=Allosphingosinicella sp. TaxID=2823234 RepID=UPI00394F7660